MMFTSTPTKDFPPYERKIDPITRITIKPHVASQEIGSDGKIKQLSQTEEVLNWKIENSKARNSIL